MALMPTLLLWLPSVAYRQVARRQLAARLPPAQAAQAWQAAQSLQRTLAPRRPRHAPGLSLVFRYMEWHRALYTAVQQQGLDPAQSGALVEDINRELFGVAIGAGFRLSRLRSPARQTRVRWLMDLMFRLLFTAPFRRELRPSTRGVAFNVTVCPFADYFQAQGTPALTRHAACNLDYDMAKRWGMHLDRTQTLAGGAPHCNFHFLPAPPETSPQE